MDSSSAELCALAGAAVSGLQRRQVTDVRPPPPPRVTEYQLISRVCPGCSGSRPRSGSSPRCGPAPPACSRWRSCPGSGELLATAGVLHVDETPARADGGLEYVHVACTEFLTAMHTGGRSKTAIDAAQVLPGYTGTIVRDGYGGYTHLVQAHHPWCRAHLLRDLAAVHTPRPRPAVLAAAMVDTLTQANQHANTAQTTLDRIRTLYHGATTAGITDNKQRTAGGCWRTLQGLADSPSSAPTCPPPPSGASTASTPSNSCSPPAPGSPQPPHLLMNSYVPRTPSTGSMVTWSRGGVVAAASADRWVDTRPVVGRGDELDVPMCWQDRSSYHPRHGWYQTAVGSREGWGSGVPSC